MSELSRGTFRASRRVLFVVALFAVLAIGRPAPVHAATTQPYLDDAVKALLYDNVTGNAWPDTFPAEWAKPNATRVARVAQFLPPLRAVGTIGLGLSAFELGWKIGRTIDERWLHLSSSMTSGRNRSADGSCTGWEIAAEQFDWSPSAAPGYFLLTFESWRPDGTPNGNSTVWPSSTNTCFGAYQAATQGLAGGPAVINRASVWIATEAEMLGKMHIVDEPYAGQPYSQAMWWSVPPMTDTVIQSIRDSIAAEGPALRMR
jgi:hypothetical protein